MIGPSGNVRVYLACGVTDMRRGIDGLSALVETVVKEAPGSGAIFGFRGKRADRIKLLWWDGQGFCLFYKILERGQGPANIVVWPSLFEKRRRVVLGSSMMAINGRIQREGEVVHLIAQQLFDLSADLVGLADRDVDFKLPTGRGDEFAQGGGPDSRERPKPIVPRDMFTPDLHIDTLKVKARNFQ